MSTQHDAIVIGGGPGGAACAATLARGGRRVLVLEQHHFPRDHVGESLSPAAWEAAQQLGAGEELAAARFAPKNGATFDWGNDPRPWTVAYQTADGQPSAYQVRRAEFDAILLRAAAAAGAEVRLGWRAQEVIFSAGRADGVVAAAPGGRPERLHAPWIVDASGDPGLLSDRLGRVAGPPELNRVAVWGLWRRTAEPGGHPDATSILVGHDGICLWYYPLGEQGKVASVGVVAPAGSTHGRPAASREEFYRAAVGSCAQLAQRVSGAVLECPVREGAARASASPRMAGEGWFLAGDAACFVDALLTPGVQLAIQHGTLAAACIQTILAEPAAQAAALDLYDHTVRRQYDTFTRLSQNLYRAAGLPAEPGRTAGRQHGPEPNGQFAFLSLISGLPQAELAARLGAYIGWRKHAAARGGAPVVMGEKEGFAFLAWHFHTGELARARAQRVSSALGEDCLVEPAPGIVIGEHLFVSPDGTQALRRGQAVSNRLGDRFAASPELLALFEILGAGCSYPQLRHRFCQAAAVPVDACRPEFGDWIELLADHALVEWRPTGREDSCAVS